MKRNKWKIAGQWAVAVAVVLHLGSCLFGGGLHLPAEQPSGARGGE